MEEPVDPIDQLEAVLKDIDKMIKNFTVIGEGVSGHITSGYIVQNPPPESQQQ